MRELRKLLFVCIENAGRSQMAEAFANHYGKGKLMALSAGNKPADKVNPVVVEAMKEKDIDISMNKPKLLTFQMAQDADLIVTMGCADQGICPGPFFKPTVDWKLEDPKGKPIEEVRRIRDKIERRVQELIGTENPYEGVVRVKSWDEFKRLVDEQKPSSVVYVIEQSGFSPTRELTTLRLMFTSSKAHYVFLDFPKGETLRETHIPLSKDKRGNVFIEEEDVKSFLKKQLGKENLTICAYWTI